MTSFAFIMGVLPLVFASGAGAEMRHAMGVAVFSGMLGVTFFGLVAHAGVLRDDPRAGRTACGAQPRAIGDGAGAEIRGERPCVSAHWLCSS